MKRLTFVLEYVMWIILMLVDLTLRTKARYITHLCCRNNMTFINRDTIDIRCNLWALIQQYSLPSLYFISLGKSHHKRVNHPFTLICFWCWNKEQRVYNYIHSIQKTENVAPCIASYFAVYCWLRRVRVPANNNIYLEKARHWRKGGNNSTNCPGL